MRWLVYLMEGPSGMNYVGCTSTPLEVRMRSHHLASIGSAFARSNPKGICAAVRKYGISAFAFSVAGRAPDKISALKLERQKMDELGTWYPRGYNLRPGGKRHLPHPIALANGWPQ